MTCGTPFLPILNMYIFSLLTWTCRMNTPVIMHRPMEGRLVLESLAAQCERLLANDVQRVGPWAA